MNVHEVLVKARNHLDRVGWCQRPGSDYRKADRPQCIRGAVHVVAGFDTHNPAWQPLYDVLGTFDIVTWNDASGRTKAEVLAAFDAAIAATAPEPMDPLHGVETREPVAA